MIISYHGAEFIKITFGDTTIAFNPPSKDSKIKASRFGADIAFVSLNHPDMNGGHELARGEKEPFVIDRPGEYEVQGVFSIGVPSVSHYGEDELINTVFAVQFEGMNILYAGALDAEKLDQSELEDIESVDILFVPIGGQGVLGPEEAQKLATSLEAKVVIPIHWEDMGEKNALKTFLKEAGQEDVKPIDKFTVKRKDIADMNGQVVVLSKA
jgi:L-ascorbate metabolism protein UlaG (beta-lactamase superfamily)